MFFFTVFLFFLYSFFYLFIFPFLTFHSLPSSFSPTFLLVFFFFKVSLFSFPHVLTSFSFRHLLVPAFPLPLFRLSTQTPKPKNDFLSQFGFHMEKSHSKSGAHADTRTDRHRLGARYNKHASRVYNKNKLNPPPLYKIFLIFLFKFASNKYLDGEG
jgi:hypothetical protein